MAEKDVTPSARARYKELCDTVPMEKLLDALHSRGGVYDESKYTKVLCSDCADSHKPNPDCRYCRGNGLCFATSTSPFGVRHKELMKHSNDPTWKRVDQMTPEEYRERYEALIAEGIKPDPDGLGGRRYSPDGDIILCHHLNCGSKSCGFCNGRGVIYVNKHSMAHLTHCEKMSAASKKVDVPTSWTPAVELTPKEYAKLYKSLSGVEPDPNSHYRFIKGSPDAAVIPCLDLDCRDSGCASCKGKRVTWAHKNSTWYSRHLELLSRAEFQKMGKEFKQEILGEFPVPVKYNTQEFQQRLADKISAEIASGISNVGEISYSNGTQVLYPYYGPKTITTSTDIKLKEQNMMNMNNKSDSEAKPVSVATQQRVMKVAETIDTIVDDTKSASVRAAASQFVKLTREPLVAALTRGLGMEDNETSRAAAARFLRSPLGDALVSGMLSMGVTALPVKGNLKNEISKELRIRAMSTAMDETVDLIMGPFRTVTGQLLQGGIELNLLEEGTPNTLKLETHIAEKVEVTDE